MKTRPNVSKSGQTLVEFALIIPLFILMVMFIFDIGRAVYNYSVMYNAVREGARVAAVGETDVALIKGIVVDRAFGMDLNASDVAVNWSGNVVTLTANYEYNPITPIVSAFMPGGDLDLHVETSMRLEFP
jgi:Flp pilus assembly protein TadG